MLDTKVSNFVKILESTVIAEKQDSIINEEISISKSSEEGLKSTCE